MFVSTTLITAVCGEGWRHLFMPKYCVLNTVTCLTRHSQWLSIYNVNILRAKIGLKYQQHLGYDCELVLY